MQFVRLTFENPEGRKLAARLDLPLDTKPLAYALFAHCFTCTKNIKAIGHIARALTQEAIAVLRFDFTGIGQSEGDFSKTNLSSNVEDLIAAARFLEEEFEPPRILIGHSLGGAAVLMAASDIPSSKAVATIAAPSDPDQLSGFAPDFKETLKARGQLDVEIGGQTFTLGKEFLEDLERTDLLETIHNLGKALLIFHSPRDRIVNIENAARLFQAARHPKSFISLDRADHLLSDSSDSYYAGVVLAAWARKYVNGLQQEKPGLDIPNKRVVVRTGGTGYQTEIRMGRHGFISDEPIGVGGADSGPNPYDYLLAALGACTSITLRMFADRKGWPLNEIVVRLNHENIHADDCRKCETKAGRMLRIERELDLVGPLDDHQRNRLLEIADRCPVGRALRGEVFIDTRLRAAHE